MDQRNTLIDNCLSDIDCLSDFLKVDNINLFKKIYVAKSVYSKANRLYIKM